MTLRGGYVVCLCLFALMSACTLPRERAVRTAPTGQAEPREETPALQSPPQREHGAKLEEGIASWYGPAFHGKATANGERYEQDRLTAAHRTLPFNTLLWVHRPSRDLWVPVRVNDRGPYVAGRMLDLSRAAARRLQLLEDGTDRVVLYAYRSGSGDPPPPVPVEAPLSAGGATAAPLERPDLEEREAEPLPASPAGRLAPPVAEPQVQPPAALPGPVQGGVRLQVGAFASPANARRLLARMRKRFPDLGWGIEAGEGWYRVLSAPQRPGAELDARLAALRSAGVSAVLRRSP